MMEIMMPFQRKYWTFRPSSQETVKVMLKTNNKETITYKLNYKKNSYNKHAH